MATGDKLFLADKQTLDEVKQNTESILQDASDYRQILDNIQDNMNKLPNQVATNDYYKVSDIAKFQHRTFNIDNTNKVLLNLTTPGTLYYAVLFSYTGGLTVTTHISIDGQSIMNGASTTTTVSIGTGIVAAPMIIGVNSSNQVLVAGVSGSVNGGFSPLMVNSTNPNMLAIKPIKWDNSLYIRSSITSGTASNCYMYVCYSLD